jgi:uncharacterized protein YukE
MIGGAKPNIPTGMAGMLKMIGLDPEQISKAITEVSGAVREIAERLERIERKIDELRGDENGGRSSAASPSAAGSNGQRSGR